MPGTITLTRPEDDVSDTPQPIEETSLPAHVALCGQRYRDLARRLGRVEVLLGIVILLLLVGEGTIADVAKRLFLPH